MRRMGKGGTAVTAVARGNVGHTETWSLTVPPACNYYWSVQAVDGAYRGSAPHPFQPESVLPGTPGFFVATVAGLPGLEGSSSAWGDYDADGDLDLVLLGRLQGGFVYVTRIYRNDGNVFDVDV